MRFKETPSAAPRPVTSQLFARGFTEVADLLLEPRG